MTIESNMLNQAYFQESRADRGQRAARTAQKLYRNARLKARLGQVWMQLTGRSHRLLPLKEVLASCSRRGSHYAGLKTVPIRQIRGSEGRCQDFDGDLRPIQPHNQSRWLSVATACQMSVSLPPVELIQVGQVYFVRDGHHRISVAKALGQEHIEAEVTLWDVSGPLPWEKSTPAVEMAVQTV
jgi:hypothetical protein